MSQNDQDRDQDREQRRKRDGGLQEAEYPDLPDGWQWAGGEVARSNYTLQFETEYRMGGPLAGVGSRLGGCSGEVYWDRGGDGDHHVQIRPIVGMDGDDPVYDYADVFGRYDSKQEAISAVPRLIERLYRRALFPEDS